MADIRINALTTTAASTASDDFVAVDGSANGTRKLNAYSPTFGGNLTVSGTGTSGGSIFTANTGLYQTDASASNYSATNGVYINGNSAGWLQIAGDGTRASSIRIHGSTHANAGKIEVTATNTTLSGNLTVNGTVFKLNALAAAFGDGTTLYLYSQGTGGIYGRNKADTADIFRVTNTGDFTAVGNLTVSGTGNSSVAGTLLVATTTNSSNGKLQLADHSTSAGGIGFGANMSLYKGANGLFGFDDTSAANDTRLFLYNNGTLRGAVEAYGVASAVYLGAASVGWSTYITSGNQAIALTLDSSQNATFAGTGINSFKGTLTLNKSGGAILNLNSTTDTPGVQFAANTSRQIEIYTNVGVASKKTLIDENGDVTLVGKITTSAPTGGAGAWELGVYSATAPTATGYVTIEIGGVQYKLLAST